MIFDMMMLLNSNTNVVRVARSESAAKLELDISKIISFLFAIIYQYIIFRKNRGYFLIFQAQSSRAKFKNVNNSGYAYIIVFIFNTDD